MNISVFGLGVSGLGVLRALKQERHNVLAINQGTEWIEDISNKYPKFRCIEERLALEALLESDQIILSPGISRAHPFIAKAINKGIDVISEIEFAFRRSSTPVIAITGSNGKTTTATMITESLISLGKKVFLGGNIGVSYCDIIDKNYDYAVIELSSFQLESIDHFKPLVSIITNITPNHMERYESFNEYKNTKLNIFKNQKEGLILSDDSSYIPNYLLHEQIKPLIGFDFSRSNIVGDHNKLNFFCAYEVCSFLIQKDIREGFQSFINSFKGVKYRLELLGELRGLKFFNDAKSTNLASTLTALHSFKGTPLYLIMGGKQRSADLKEFQVINELKLKKIFLFGEAAKNLNLNNSQAYDKLSDVFCDLADLEDGVIVFSPGFPSFDQYKNYIDRGQDFELNFNKLSSKDLTSL